LLEQVLPRLRDLNFAQQQRLVTLFAAPACLGMFTNQVQVVLGLASDFVQQDYNSLMDKMGSMFVNATFPQSPINQSLLSWAYIAAIETERIDDLIAMGIVYDTPDGQLPVELEILGAQFQQRGFELLIR
ncbi:MAG: hypothetical protein RL120_14900, partial [Gammaproteobacteria bacterium]